MTTKKHSGISRRTFIKGTAATGASVIAGTTGGLFRKGSGEAYGSEDQTVGIASSFQPIPESEIHQVVGTDVVVAGAGTAGLAATLSAAESGSPIFLVALGGMNVNPDLQALDAERKVIPGLYLAGNTAGGFFGNDYPTMVAGLSHGRALTFGFIAGKNAAGETT